MTSALVVDDSQFMRTVVGNELRANGYDVVEASNGEAAVEKVHEHEPDVITMDVAMPGMDGIEAVERIMADRPTPILMVSAHTERGADATLDALEKGAVDFIQKPDGEVSIETGPLEAELVEKVEAALGADPGALDSLDGAAGTVQAAGGGEAVSVAAAGAEPDLESPPTTAEEMAGVIDERLAGEYAAAPTVVVGASTGGPKVVNALMAELPRALDARVLIVQHMPEAFTGRFADRLDALSAYDVAEATDGERITGGEARVAPGGRHLEVAACSSGRVRLRVTDDDPVNGVAPSIDVTMESAAEVVDGALAGVVLTGMGADGAAGVRAIKDAGGTTVAQDEATSPVFGIPERAIETGRVDEVLPAGEIAAGLVEAFDAGED